jgi:hypothetical protein
MNPKNQEAWKSQALDTIFEALAANKTLEGKFAYKGARVLSKLLGGNHRQSYDIDMNLMQSFVDAYPDPDEQATCLHHEISIGLTAFFRAQDPLRYKLKGVKLTRRPKDDHPHGWNAFEVRIGLEDLAMAGVTNLPVLELDIAAPEELGPRALGTIVVGQHTIVAYTLERIAGEKLRAFLSSLPAYRAKMKRPGDSIRAKDIFDLARILQAHAINDEEFWHIAGEEFSRACASRYIDCRGLETFEEQLDLTRATYERDAIIPKNISFDAAWNGIREIVQKLTLLKIIPFENPVPASV